MMQAAARPCRDRDCRNNTCPQRQRLGVERQEIDKAIAVALRNRCVHQYRLRQPVRPRQAQFASDEFLERKIKTALRSGPRPSITAAAVRISPVPSRTWFGPSSIALAPNLIPPASAPLTTA